MKVIDASECVLGRLASRVAKELLNNEDRVVVVNADSIVVSGSKDFLLEYYYHKRERGDPIKGPFYPREPHMIFKRAVRGMLPKNKRGRDALKRLTVYRNTPKMFEGKVEKLKIKTSEDLRCKYLYLKDISNKLGIK
jgi:large subunit ribosomal protein L13